MAHYFGRTSAVYLCGLGYEPWPQQTLVMKCDYCGSHGTEYQCRNCGAPVAPKPPALRRDRVERIEVTSFGDPRPSFLEAVSE